MDLAHPLVADSMQSIQVMRLVRAQNQYAVLWPHKEVASGGRDELFCKGPEVNAIHGSLGI
jgi:hypothetical protein